MQYLTGTSILAISYRIISICRLGYYTGNNSETGSRNSATRTGVRVRLPGPGPQDSGPSRSRLFLSERRWFKVGRFLLFNVQQSRILRPYRTCVEAMARQILVRPFRVLKCVSCVGVKGLKGTMVPCAGQSIRRVQSSSGILHTKSKLGRVWNVSHSRLHVASIPR
jgi:hypothetical protein